MGCRFLEGLKVTADQGHVRGGIEGNRFPVKQAWLGDCMLHDVTSSEQVCVCNVVGAGLRMWVTLGLWTQCPSNITQTTFPHKCQWPSNITQNTKGGLCNVWRSLAFVRNKWPRLWLKMTDQLLYIVCAKFEDHCLVKSSAWRYCHEWVLGFGDRWKLCIYCTTWILHQLKYVSLSSVTCVCLKFASVPVKCMRGMSLHYYCMLNNYSAFVVNTLFMLSVHENV